MKENFIEVKKTARYYSLGNIDTADELWIVVHGYAELAKDFLNGFEMLDNGKRFIVAPEALNKFYLKGFYGKIGTTWMTKEDRANEIEDYLFYLTKLFNELTGKKSYKKINLLGFSQGTATVCRFVQSVNLIPTNLFLCGGFIPEDINAEHFAELSNKTELSLFIGDNDKYISEERIDECKEYLIQTEIKHTLEIFNGKHEINNELLSLLIK